MLTIPRPIKPYLIYTHPSPRCCAEYLFDAHIEDQIRLCEHVLSSACMSITCSLDARLRVPKMWDNYLHTWATLSHFNVEWLLDYYIEVSHAQIFIKKRSVLNEPLISAVRSALPIFPKGYFTSPAVHPNASNNPEAFDGHPAYMYYRYLYSLQVTPASYRKRKPPHWLLDMITYKWETGGFIDLTDTTDNPGEDV